MKETDYKTLPPLPTPKRIIWEPLFLDTDLLDPDADDDRMINVCERGTVFLITIEGTELFFQLPDGYAICKQVGR